MHSSFFAQKTKKKEKKREKVRKIRKNRAINEKNCD
uniref:Uncharacterized protein n=1 Tax=Siphoviridae sp. ct3z32 TaxID=2825327 RepID=A0A8S5VHI2_9CAUD|nr:MAG TPA: hypothetical protein [Siphoviridae sp. ct3z32]